MAKIILRVLIFIIALCFLGFDALLYRSFEEQKQQVEAMGDQQKLQAQLATNQLKYQQDKIDNLSSDLDKTLQEVEDRDNTLNQQKEALVQEIQKRQQTEDENKRLQTSLIDIKAETDAVKEQMKAWQKDYVSILAELEKKVDSAQENIGSLKNEIATIIAQKDNKESDSKPVMDNEVSNAPKSP